MADSAATLQTTDWLISTQFLFCGVSLGLGQNFLLSGHAAAVTLHVFFSLSLFFGGGGVSTAAKLSKCVYANSIAANILHLPKWNSRC